jgi:phosphoethanolamine N-methyltransferase
MSDNIQYPDHFLARLHTIWGEGFLSPGGPEEVGEIIRDVDLTDKTVLDIGFGTGGPSIVLAKNHHAGKIIGIDVEMQLRDRAQINIDKAGVANRIDLRIVVPGPLPFDDESFDVVFSKDSMVHIPDKQALFQEIKRVLIPGGAFVASDWLSGSKEDAIPSLNKFKELAHLTFAMANATEMETYLADAGFENISSRDRNAWFAPIANHEVEQIEGPLKKQLIDEVGEEIFGYWTQVKKAMANAASAGGLRPTHLKAFKPSS